MPKPVEGQALHAPFVDDRKQLVLEIGPAARDLVEEHRFGVPDRRGRLQVDQLARLRHGEPDQVIEIQQRRVVVPERDAERLGQARQDERLRRSRGGR